MMRETEASDLEQSRYKHEEGTRDKGLIFSEKRLDFFAAVGKSLWKKS